MFPLLTNFTLLVHVKAHNFLNNTALNNALRGTFTVISPQLYVSDSLLSMFTSKNLKDLYERGPAKYVPTNHLTTILALIAVSVVFYTIAKASKTKQSETSNHDACLNALTAGL
jgi:hypothetical protein